MRGVMFLRHTKRKKDGKEHRYWSIVENRRVGGGRVVQRPLLYLGEINDSQELAWRKSIAVLEEGAAAKKKGTGAMSGKPGRCGRKSFVATPEQRNNVKILVGLGVPAGDDLPVGGEPADRQAIGWGDAEKAFSARNRGG